MACRRSFAFALISAVCLQIFLPWQFDDLRKTASAICILSKTRNDSPRNLALSNLSPARIPGTTVATCPTNPCDESPQFSFCTLSPHLLNLRPLFLQLDYLQTSTPPPSRRRRIAPSPSTPSPRSPRSTSPLSKPHQISESSSPSLFECSRASYREDIATCPPLKLLPRAPRD